MIRSMACSARHRKNRKRVYTWLPPSHLPTCRTRSSQKAVKELPDSATRRAAHGGGAHRHVAIEYVGDGPAAKNKSKKIIVTIIIIKCLCPTHANTGEVSHYTGVWRRSPVSSGGYRMAWHGMVWYRMRSCLMGTKSSTTTSQPLPTLAAVQSCFGWVSVE